MAEEKYLMDLRRVRTSSHVRELAASVRLSHRAFIQPLFVDEGLTSPRAINGLHGVFVDATTSIIQTIENDMARGITKFLLFPVPLKKGETNFDFSFAAQTVHIIKKTFVNSIWLAADLCLCSYTAHGHCGVLTDSYDAIDNDRSVSALSNYALHLAEAGIDCIAPSDMMDGRIRSIRSSLDQSGHENISILAYSAKFSSQFYGPFRDACHSSPKGGQLKDRKSYQLSPSNLYDALHTALRDEEEGADFIMVKPATLYLDVISAIRKAVRKPVAAYHVSGEYAAIEALASMQMLDRKAAHLEAWTSLARGGADIIISYAARNAREWIENMEL